MKVSKDQIEDLYAFTIKHYVEHYDLQTELVDHMANDVEGIWESEPHLTYFEARDKAFKKFGIYGFMEVVEQREKAMTKRYLKILWKEFKKWLGVPKIAILITVFIFFYVSLSSTFANYCFMTFYCLMFVWGLYKTIQLRRQYRRRREKSKKKWLLEDIIFKQFAGISILFISQFYNVFNISSIAFTDQKMVIITSIILTLACLIVYISLDLLPRKADDVLSDTYPEFSL